MYPPLETEITLSVCNIMYMLIAGLLNLWIGNLFYFPVDELHSKLSCLRACIILEILLKCHECVRMTAIKYLHALAQCHKTVSRSALSVASCTEGWNIVHLHKPVYHLVKCSLVADIKLLRCCLCIFLSLWVCIASDTCL